jgi:hypothetical protein
MFTNLYLTTTDPTLSFTKMISENKCPLLMSVLFHAIVYVLSANVTNYIFFGGVLSNQINHRLLIVLILILSLGYVARFYHVKEIYRAYGGDMVKTRNHLDNLYISWTFIA